jgi:hypothetical protein
MSWMEDFPGQARRRGLLFLEQAKIAPDDSPTDTVRCGMDVPVRADIIRMAQIPPTRASCCHSRDRHRFLTMTQHFRHAAVRNFGRGAWSALRILLPSSIISSPSPPDRRSLSHPDASPKNQRCIQIAGNRLHPNTLGSFFPDCAYESRIVFDITSPLKYQDAAQAILRIQYRANLHSYAY